MGSRGARANFKAYAVFTKVLTKKYWILDLYCKDWVRVKGSYMVARFSANFSKNCSEAVRQ